jgi:hypothetical protein
MGVVLKRSKADASAFSSLKSQGLQSRSLILSRQAFYRLVLLTDGAGQIAVYHI